METDDFNALTYNIIGAAFAVHQELGCGFKEDIYQEALALEFSERKIPFVREKHFSVYYKGNLLKTDFFADFVCYERIIVELKALSALNNEHRAQVLNYLKASNFEVGLLLNFGETSLKHERLVFSKDKTKFRY